MQLRTKDFVEKVLKDYPDFKFHSIQLVGGGWHNIAFEVNHEWIFRFSKDPKRGYLQKEFGILRAVENRTTLRTPQPVFVGKEYMGYKKIPGVSLLKRKRNFTQKDWIGFSKSIGKFLGEVNTVPKTVIQKYKIQEDGGGFNTWREDARGDFKLVRHLFPKKFIPAIEDFLATPPPEYIYTSVFCHNDLGAEHIFISPKNNSVIGIIDWGDATFADPAFDLGRLYRDLGDKVLKEILVHYPSKNNKKSELYKRAIICAQYSIFEEMRYGLEEGKPDYISKSIKMLPQLFG